MKKIGLLILVVLILTGCSSFTDEKMYYFEKISIETDGYIVYDKRTGVQYWVSDSAYNRGTLTLLVDDTGKPLIYDGLEAEHE